MGVSSESASAGRPRSEETRRAILRAALKLLETRPPTEVTLKAIAEASGAGRQTLYRWWSNRGQIILEALRESGREHIHVSNNAPFEAAFAQFLEATVRQAKRLRPALRVIITDAQLDETFLPEFRDEFVHVRRAALFEVMARSNAFSALSPREQTFLGDLIFGPLWYRVLVSHAPLDSRFAVELQQLALGWLQGRSAAFEDGRDADP